MQPLEVYLKEQGLEALTVAVVAKVRNVTVWNALKGNPIATEQAGKIRMAVLTLTGLLYTGPLEILPSAIDQQPTMPLRQVPGRRGHT